MVLLLLVHTMSHRKTYLYDDMSILAKIIDEKFRKLNENKDTIYLTEQEYKECIEYAIEKITGVARCQGIYVSGKHRNEKCRASPHGDSKYCLKHINQHPQYKKDQETKSKISELVEKAKHDPGNKKLYETQITELLEELNINYQ
jgi:hypothetical protein